MANHRSHPTLRVTPQTAPRADAGTLSSQLERLIRLQEQSIIISKDNNLLLKGIHSTLPLLQQCGAAIASATSTTASATSAIASCIIGLQAHGEIQSQLQYIRWVGHYQYFWAEPPPRGRSP